MAENTKIEWARHTWNPWIGCTEVGPACERCYARVLMAERYGRVRWGAGEDRLRTSAQNWNEPKRWDRAAAKAGRVDTVFCLSLGDIWDNEVGPMWRRDAFAVMEATPNLLYLLLSKRIGNAIKMCDPMRGNPGLPKNAALGATMVTQEEWDRDLPKLKEAGQVLGARFIFASVEPMLERIVARDFPDWVIVGGESGPKARPMHPDWARSIRDQCGAAGVAFFFKQWGEWATAVDHPRSEYAGWTGADLYLWIDGEVCDFSAAIPGRLLSHATRIRRVGKKAAGRLLDGIEHSGFPR